MDIILSKQSLINIRSGKHEDVLWVNSDMEDLLNLEEGDYECFFDTDCPSQDYEGSIIIKTFKPINKK